MSNVETPSYEVISKNKKIEIRLYEPMVIAEVIIDGERKDAIGDGFRILADYIFGNNTVNKKIDMAAPVQQQANEKIAMTAPVQQQPDGTKWKVSFVMPSEYILESLPKPNNNRVLLHKIESKRFVVIRFSGKNSEKNIEKNKKKLIDYIQNNEIKVIGEPQYAFYNPPWTFPALRRNEIMFQIKQ